MNHRQERKEDRQIKRDIENWERFGHTIEKVTGGPIQSHESRERLAWIDHLAGPIGRIASALEVLKPRNY